METVVLSNKELKQINGGTYESGYEVGHAIGEIVRKTIAGAKLLQWFFL